MKKQLPQLNALLFLKKLGNNAWFFLGNFLHRAEVLEYENSDLINNFQVFHRVTLPPRTHRVLTLPNVDKVPR